MLSYLNSVVFQTSSNNQDFLTPWDLPFVWFIVAFLVEFALAIMIWIWARSGRSKREKDVPFDRTAENFAGTVQAGYGAVPTFLYIVWFAVLLFIACYVILNIITGTQY